MSKIYERNPDTGEIRSRTYGSPTRIVEAHSDDNAKESIRESILSDIWAANKKVVDGKWYVELSQVAEIIGGSDDGE